MALREKLQVIVDADVGGFVRGMDKSAAAADRLGKSTDKLDALSGKLTSFGVGALGAGAVAAVGLNKLAQSASNYGEALNKATVIAGKQGVKALSEFADTAADTAGISKTAALDAASGFAALGKQAGFTGPQLSKFSTGLVQLAGDLASFNNTTVDDALQALKSGLQGETEPLKRFNIFLNDTALKQEYLAVTGEKVTGVLSTQQRIVAAQSLIWKQSADAQGDFARTSDSLANRQRKFQAEVENLKAALGAGLLPMFETLAGGATAAAEAFSSLSPEAQKLIGSAAGFVTFGTVVAGGLSLAAGQAIKMRDAFTTVTVVGDASTRSLNNLGKAAAGIAVVSVAVGGLIALNSAIEAGVGGAEQLAGALADLQKAQSDFARAAAVDDAVQGALKQDFVVKSLTGTFSEAEARADAFNEALEQSPALAQLFIDTIKRGGDYKILPDDAVFDVDELNGKIPIAASTVRGWQDAVDGKRETDIAAATAQAEYNTEVQGAVEANIAAAESADVAAQSYLDYADAVAAALDPVFATTKAFQDNSDAKIDVVKAQAEVNRLQAEGKAGTDEFAEAQRKLSDANRAQVASALDVQGAMGALLQQVKENPESWEQAGAALDEWVASGLVTADQAQTVRNEILLAVGAAESADRTKAEMEIKANVGSALFNIQAAVDRATAAARGDYTLVIKANVGTVLSQLNTIMTVAQTTAAVVSAVKGANGMIRMANGGTLPDQALIQPATGGLVQWAEPETMGEAFIPLAPAKRKRSKDIWWETGRRLGVVQMAAGGFTADTLWGAIAESQKNQFDLAFDSLPPALQLANLRDQLAQLHPFSDEWTRVMRDIMRREQDVAESALDAQRDRADNEWAWNYERAKVEDRIILATQKRDSFQQWTDEWVRWAEELEQLQADAKEQLTPRANASGGRSGGQAPFYLTVNVNAEGLVTDPQEVGRQVVGAIRSYETANGTGWRA